MDPSEGPERRRGERRELDPRVVAAQSRRGPWGDVHQPVKVLVYLLIGAVLITLYRDTQVLVDKVFGVILLFVFAAIIAMLLNPVVDAVESRRWVPGGRGVAVLVVNLLIMVAFAGFLAALIPSVVQQSTSLGESAPRLLNDAQGFVGGLEADLNRRGIPVHFQIPSGMDSLIAPVLGSAVQILTQTLGAVVNLILITVIAIYLQIEGRQIVAALRQLFPERQDLFDFTLVAAGSTLAGYVRGQVIFAAIMAAYTGLMLSLIGVHYALVISVVTFFLELVPLIGAPVAMAVAIVLAVLQGPFVILLTAVFTVAGHFAGAYTIGLKVVGDSTRLHPLVAMLALVAGASVGGILGALFAIPIAGIVNVYLGALYRVRRGEEAFSLPDQDRGSVTLAQLPNLGEEIQQMAEDEEIAREPIPKVVKRKVTASDPRPRRTEAVKPAAVKAAARARVARPRKPT